MYNGNWDSYSKKDAGGERGMWAVDEKLTITK